MLTVKVGFKSMISAGFKIRPNFEFRQNELLVLVGPFSFALSFGENADILLCFSKMLSMFFVDE